MHTHMHMHATNVPVVELEQNAWNTARETANRWLRMNHLMQDKTDRTLHTRMLMLNQPFIYTHTHTSSRLLMLFAVYPLLWACYSLSNCWAIKYLRFEKWPFFTCEFESVSFCRNEGIFHSKISAISLSNSRNSFSDFFHKQIQLGFLKYHTQMRSIRQTAWNILAFDICHRSYVMDSCVWVSFANTIAVFSW